MSTLRDQLDDHGPRLAWVWTTETMKNCMMGQHEAEGPPLCICGSGLPWCMACGIHHREKPNDSAKCWPHLAAGQFPGVHGLQPPVCRHCRCLFVEKP